jgi:copper oxidase (laccase) domain-containing protein
MSLHWGSRATDLLVGIGPSIGPCCYAVGDDVVLATTVAFTDESALITHRSCQSYLDLWRANRIALEHSGVRCENIHVAGLCTACRPDLFFSHRAEQGRAGRFAAVIKLLNGET